MLVDSFAGISTVPSDTSTQLLRLHDFNRVLVVAVSLNDIEMAKTLVRLCMDGTPVENSPSVVPRLTKVLVVAVGTWSNGRLAVDSFSWNFSILARVRTESSSEVPPLGWFALTRSSVANK